MFRRVFFLILLFCSIAIFKIGAQNSKVFTLSKKFANYYAIGDLLNAEKCLLEVLYLKDSISVEQSIAISNNLGVVYIRLGRYDDAIKYLNLAEDEVNDKHDFLQELADIYINKSRVFGIVKEYDKAIEYLEQGIRIYLSTKNTDKSLFMRLSIAYLNIGLIYYEKQQYNIAIQYLNKSIELKYKYNLSEIAFTYLNLAKTYSKLNQVKSAQHYYLKSIEAFDREFGPNYYRLTSVLFDYGLFLRSIGKEQEALEVHQRALNICLKNYGEKHAYISLAYKHIGNHYFIESDFKKALQYYQKSIMAVVKNFNDTNIDKNPSLDSVIFDIGLLDGLKQKALALEQFALINSDLNSKKQFLAKSLETIELGLVLIGRIRNGYISVDSKMYLADNEKETYLLAVQIAYELYNQTRDSAYIKKMYDIATLCKSAILRNEIAENEFLNKTISDSLFVKRKTIRLNASSYKKLIQDELQITKPDSQKIELWKSSLFEMNRKEEQLEEKIKSVSPGYSELLIKSRSTGLKMLQSYLKKDETLIEYFLSNNYKEGRRLLYIFTISENKLDCTTSYVDSVFSRNVKLFKQGITASGNSSISGNSYQEFKQVLYFFYEKLLKPIKANLTEKLIIIPDEEIAYLPFEAFVIDQITTEQKGYDELHYLLYDYSITYGYTSSLLFQKQSKTSKNAKVFAFSPSSKEGYQKGYSALKGADNEINSIYKWYNGKTFFGSNASEYNFKEVIKKPAIIHLAMHTQTDSSNSKYSSLIFNTKTDTINDGKLYNYEISLSRVESPLVVLSGCSTADGNLYHGEGIMSLARGFLVAGASSVVNTLWDVNDDASFMIMKEFYHNLSIGYEKGEALRLAKINYLKKSPPTYANPYFWAAFEVMGAKEPLKPEKGIFFYMVLLVVTISFISFFIYFRWVRRS